MYIYVLDVGNTYIEIPIGSSVEVRLYDPLIIPVFYGSYPRLNISQSDVEISVMDMAGAAVTEPTYNRINAFHVDIQFPIAQSSLSGTYNILIRYMNSVISRQTMSIEITGKKGKLLILLLSVDFLNN